MNVYGEDDVPHEHMRIRFTDTRVPAEIIILGEKRGSEICGI